MFKQLFRESNAMKIGLFLAVIAAVVYVVGLLTPLNSGVPYAPGRLVLGYVWTFLRIGLLLMMWAWFSSHKTWLVPWYEEGMKIEVFSSTRVVRIALIAAATIVFAFVKIPVLGWSIRTVAPAFGMMYFGFIEGVFGGWIGYMLSTLIVGGYEDPLMMLPTSGIGDMVAVALFGLIYWARIREEPSAKTRSSRYFIALLISFAVWYVDIIAHSVGYVGAAMVIPYAIQYLAGGFMVLAIIIIIAIGAVEAMNRARRKKATPPATE